MSSVFPTVQCFKPDTRGTLQGNANFFLLPKSNFFIIGFLFSSAWQADQFHFENHYLLT
mgnify:CR=1 FL=1